MSATEVPEPAPGCSSKVSTAADSNTDRMPPDTPSVSATQHQDSHLHQVLRELAQQLDGSLVIDPESIPVWNALLRSESPLRPHPPRPLCHCRCASQKDVAACVRFAVTHRLKLYAKGQGHHYAGLSLCDRGMVIDVSALNRITVDPATQTATVEPGATMQKLREASSAHGLHFPGGHQSSVGCSGFILGGGNGWAAPRYGSGSDNVLAYKVLLPRHSTQSDSPQGHTHAGPQTDDPHRSAPAHTEPDQMSQQETLNVDAGSGAMETVWVDRDTQPELFAMLQGAGMFLAVVVEFKIQLHPITPSLPVLDVTYPLHCAPELLQLHAELLGSAHPCIEAAVAFHYIPSQTTTMQPDAAASQPSTQSNTRSDAATTPPSAAGTAQASEAPASNNSINSHIHTCYAGWVPVVSLSLTVFMTPSEESDKESEAAKSVRAAFDKVRALLPSSRLSISDVCLPYLDALSRFDGGWTWPDLCLYARGLFMPPGPLPQATVKALMSVTERMSSPRSLILVCPGVPHTQRDTALDFRGGVYVGVYAMWPRTAQGPSVDDDMSHSVWVCECERALGTDVLGLYLNEVMLDEPGMLARCYTRKTLDRLRRVKHTCDPLGLLRGLDATS